MTDLPAGDPSPDALLERARAGDFDAFAALCEPCRRPVCSYLAAAGLTGPDDAEDVFMDAILRARRSLSSFQGASSFSTWLATICRNLALDRRRAAAAHPVASLDAPSVLDPDGPAHEPRLSSDGAFPNPAPAPDPSASLDGETRAQIVRRALAALPGKTREAVVLFYLEGRSYQEISEILDIPTGTVMSRLFNGRKNLERLLRPRAADLAT